MRIPLYRNSYLNIKGISRLFVLQTRLHSSFDTYRIFIDRYVCGVAECNYLTVDEAMLRYHLKALHSEEPYFRCPHCPPPSPGQESQNIAIDKMGVHLKMHDARLYKCSHCNHHHYQRFAYICDILYHA